MSEIFQILGIGWILFSLFLLYKIRSLSLIKVGGELYIKTNSIMVMMMIIAYVIVVAMSIF